MLGRTKDQIRTNEQVKAALDTCKTLELNGLVIIGGKLGLEHYHQISQVHFYITYYRFLSFYL